MTYTVLSKWKPISLRDTNSWALSGISIICIPPSILWFYEDLKGALFSKLFYFYVKNIKVYLPNIYFWGFSKHLLIKKSDVCPKLSLINEETILKRRFFFHLLKLYLVYINHFLSTNFFLSKCDLEKNCKSRKASGYHL